ncbi:hypothetical protein, partial [Magnetospirillum moscoviense]|uniref:hypothetical protein n=1 Tax=Magnetospirillum moscoviense TaxID=1437059 RepID=UPI001C129F4E
IRTRPRDIASPPPWGRDRQYDSRIEPNIKNRSAYVILVDAVYFELQRLKKLATEHPHKLGDFLPATTKYDAEANMLTHTYAGGAEVVTKLSDIHPLPFSFAPSEDGPNGGAGRGDGIARH